VRFVVAEATTHKDKGKKKQIPHCVWDDSVGWWSGRKDAGGWVA
jgi:hypothetical protein